MIGKMRSRIIIVTVKTLTTRKAGLFSFKLFPSQSSQIKLQQQRNLHRQKNYFTTTTTAIEETTTSISKNNPTLLYLHIGPSGDCWVGHSIFAAKHNPPGYVKSIPLMKLFEEYDDEFIYEIDGERNLLIEILDENLEWAQEIYDTERIPNMLQQYIIETTTSAN
mmetsp:Transcript_7510/g.8607  ORF Transcript_7510/g.8607 Transcript_7510/m.8607 type:complete len:165 (+) Transcript_7510:95-589(+)